LLVRVRRARPFNAPVADLHRPQASYSPAATGLLLDGRLFPFELGQPLVALAAFADVGLGVPYLIVSAMGGGAGDVVAQNFEYGNAFLIVAGLLNMLVVLDAFDVAEGRK
jgi:hypothetical protein